MPDSAPLLGIDLGTQSVKVAAVRDGLVIAAATRPYPVTSPHQGWAQTDPREWQMAIDAAVDEVLAVAGRPRAVGLSGQMHGVVATGDDLTALTPAIIWADGRSAHQVARIAQMCSPEQLSRLGSAAVTGFLGPTALWLADNEPEILSKTRWLLSPKDFIRAQWTGATATDVSDASGTLLFDVVAGRWDRAALQACKVDSELLPEVIGSSDQAGVISSGPLSGVPIATGGADTACVIFGLGLQPGHGYLGLGSGTQIVSLCASPALDPSLRTHLYATVGVPGEGWYRLAAVQSGGLVLDRALSWLGATQQEVSAAMAQGPHHDDPLFSPFLAGERTPYLDPGLRGSWSQLSLTTDRAALIRSIFEGMAFTAAVATQALEGVIPKAPLAVLGGGSRDRAYLQYIADLTGLELAPVANAEGAVVGAARLAGRMLGEDTPGLLEAGGIAEVVSPTEHAVITQRFDRWQEHVNATLGS